MKTRTPKGVAALAATVAVGLAGGAAVAQAYVYTGINNWNLTESVSEYGVYSISSGGDGTAAYRWVTDPNHSTVISANQCPDGALIGSTASIPAHDTGYRALFGGAGAGFCFRLRGRVAYGAGSMSGRSGELRR